ncbi:hypothetical protein JTB14_035665 [Gonioctena quinquepunctata]|nr:hypothetical protein JTB14_035665 [Gonioctena quinquepunctata]
MLPVNMAIFNALERRNQLHMYREESRILRDRSDPFQLTDERFIDLFRLNKDLVRYLFDELVPLMQPASRITRTSCELRILAALQFFATGNYQRGAGQEYISSMSQQALSRCISEVSVLIQNHFHGTWITFPQVEKMNRIEANFFEKCGKPGVIGAIDCTHIAIIAPADEEHNYVNRKGYHSKNVQLICDPELIIMNVNANYPGSCHDSFIWRQSQIKFHLQNDYQNGQRNTWLLGDSGYPQQPWLMTPVYGALPHTPEKLYNYSHTLGRNCIGRVNGVLEGRFHCLLGERKLRYPQGGNHC